MPRNQVSVEIGALAAEVFAVIHDYARRLEWDSLLREARIVSPDEQAGLGVRTVCTGTWANLGLAMETETISFSPGQVAAVKMVRPMPFFRRYGVRAKSAGRFMLIGPLENWRRILLWHNTTLPRYSTVCDH